MNKKLPAFNTVEILTVLAFVAVLASAGYAIFRLSLDTVNRAREYSLAELMAHDLIELTISKRNEDWNSLVAGQYYVIEDPIQGLVFTAGTETIDEFTRSVTISEVQRNASLQIVQSGGTVDPSTMKATATVSWNYRGKDYEVELVHYLTNWKKF